MFLMSQSKILLSATTFKQAQVARYTAAGSRATTLRCMFTVFSSLHADDISNDRTGLKKDSTLHQPAGGRGGCWDRKCAPLTSIPLIDFYQSFVAQQNHN